MVGEIFIYWSKSHVSPHAPRPSSLSTQDAAAQRCPPAPRLTPALPPHQNFKREEQNFVVQNEINNMSFLTADNKSKMAKVGALLREEPSAGSGGPPSTAPYPTPHPASPTCPRHIPCSPHSRPTSLLLPP